MLGSAGHHAHSQPLRAEHLLATGFISLVFLSLCLSWLLASKKPRGSSFCHYSLENGTWPGTGTE